MYKDPRIKWTWGGVEMQDSEGILVLGALATSLSGVKGDGCHLWGYCLYSNLCNETAMPATGTGVAASSYWLPLTIFHHLWGAHDKPGCWGVWSEEREGRWDHHLDLFVLNCASSFMSHYKNPAGPVHGTSRIRKTKEALLLGRFHKSTQVPRWSTNWPSVTYPRKSRGYRV